MASSCLAHQPAAASSGGSGSSPAPVCHHAHAHILFESPAWPRWLARQVHLAARQQAAGLPPIRSLTNNNWTRLGSARLWPAAAAVARHRAGPARRLRSINKLANQQGPTAVVWPPPRSQHRAHTGRARSIYFFNCSLGQGWPGDCRVRLADCLRRRKMKLRRRRRRVATGDAVRHSLASRDQQQ
jgi:hypothetical protein